MDAHLSGATSSHPYGYRVPQYAAPLGILAQPVPLVSVVPPGLEIDDAPVTHPVVLEPDPPDWLKYTVDVSAPGTYAVDVRVASAGAGGSFHIEVNGVDVTGPLVIPDTGSWQSWTTIRRSGVSLAAGPQDHATQAWNVLPPGQAGGVAFTKNSTDQIALYEGLTRLRDRVTDADLRRYFKRETLGLGVERAVRTERPRKGVTITRDRWGVPHVKGTTAEDVAFGAGWATAADRQLIMELLRGPGRLAALDAPGINAFSFALSGLALVRNPGLFATTSVLLALVAVRMSDARRTLAAWAVAIAGVAFFLGMVVSITTDNPLF